MTFENLELSEIRTVIRYRPNITHWTAKNRKYHIIGVSISDSTAHDLGYKQMNLAPNSIYFFNQRDDYEATVQEIGDCFSIHFTTAEEIETDSFCKKVNDIEEFLKILCRVESAWLQGDAKSLRIKADFYDFCDLFYKAYTAPYLPSDERIHSAKAYMDLHFREKDCLRDTVALCGVTQRRFGDLYKAHFLTTPAQYLLSKKTEYAKKLLEIGYLSISEIAELAGFSDVYYFSKVFKAQTGLTPTVYRLKHKV